MGDGEKACKVRWSVPPVTLGDIGGYRPDRPDELVDQQVALVFRQAPNNAVDDIDEVHPLLPDQQITVRSDRRGHPANMGNEPLAYTTI